MGAHGGPGHLLAVEAAPAFERALNFRVIEKMVDRLSNVALRLEIHEDVAVVAKKESSVEIGRRDDGGAGGEGVGERAAGDLLGVEVGRDVDVRGGQVGGGF